MRAVLFLRLRSAAIARLNASQARLEETRNALAEEAAAYYPQVKAASISPRSSISFSFQILPDLKAQMKRNHDQQEYAVAMHEMQPTSLTFLQIRWIRSAP